MTKTLRRWLYSFAKISVVFKSMFEKKLRRKMHLFMHQWSLIMIGIQLWRICDFFFQVHDVNEKIRKKWILVTSSHLLWSGVYVGNLVMIHLIFFPKSALWKKTGKKTGKKMDKNDHQWSSMLMKSLWWRFCELLIYSKSPQGERKR